MKNIESIVGGILGGGGSGNGLDSILTAAGNAKNNIPSGLLPSDGSIPSGLPDLAGLLGGGSSS